MNEVQDLLDLAELNLIEEHISDEQKNDSVHDNEIDATLDIIAYKKKQLANKIITETGEVQDETD